MLLQVAMYTTLERYGNDIHKLIWGRDHWMQDLVVHALTRYIQGRGDDGGLPADNSSFRACPMLRITR